MASRWRLQNQYRKKANRGKHQSRERFQTLGNKQIFATRKKQVEKTNLIIEMILIHRAIYLLITFNFYYFYTPK